MPKEKPQSNSPEVQSLAMARTALGLVREMDLTPEQNKKVMAMIEEARDYEQSKNLSKAINIYNQLKKYLEVITARPNYEGLKERQIEKVNKAIAEAIVDDSLNEEKRQDLVLAMRQQIIDLEKTADEIIIPYEGVYNLSLERQFTAEQILRVILAADEEVNAEDLFVYDGTKDKKGRIINLEIGKVGDPEISYGYHAAGENHKGNHFSDETFIDLQDLNIEVRPATIGFSKIIVGWNDAQRCWLTKTGKSIQIV